MYVRRPVALVVFALLMAACGGDSGSTTSTVASTSTTTAAEATTSEATTTTTTPLTGTVQDVVGRALEDPLLGTGFHEMEWEGSFARSVESIDGSSGDVNRLAVAPLVPAPRVEGLPAGALLLEVWIEAYDGDVEPRGVAVFVLGEDGWEARGTVTAADVFAFVETTTDYEARRISGPAELEFDVTSWGEPEHGFRADVRVLEGASVGYEGEVECLIGNIALDCVLLSDDGVLRPGDEGEAVEALQEDLATLGYFTDDIDGTYSAATRVAVRALQQDHRLTRDGIAGPNTLTMIEGLIDGTLDIVMAGPSGVGDILFGTESGQAYADLIVIFDAPTSTDDWHVDACDGHDWFRAHWDGFTAIFTDRDGSRQFDGWHVSDISDVPDWLYFEYGLRPTTTWTYLQSIGAEWEPAYGGVWYQNEIGYNNGRFVAPVSDPPAGDARLLSFGTGTGAFVSC